jgi:hypothetical protein
VWYVQAAMFANPPAGDHYRAQFERRTIMTLCNSIGVCKRVELESVSDDLVRLVKQLGDEVEGEVRGEDLKNIENKLEKIING